MEAEREVGQDVIYVRDSLRTVSVTLERLTFSIQCTLTIAL